MSNVGFRIVKHFERAPQEILEGFRGIATSNISDVMGRFRALDASINPINKPGIHFVGSALTVRTHPSDNLMVHKAMDMAQPGDVIVVDACGDMGNAILGELMCRYANRQGVAGFIVDGPIRDRTAIAEMGFPVFARGATPRGPYKEGPGEINTVISCGNVPVSPGDVIVADDDGVVVIPREQAADILSKAKEIEEKEKQIIEDIAAGNWDRTWVNETLKRKGCEFVD